MAIINKQMVSFIDPSYKPVARSWGESKNSAAAEDVSWLTNQTRMGMKL